MVEAGFQSKPRIRISDEGTGKVVVIGYSGIAKNSIQELVKKYPDIKVTQSKHHI